ncbi:hypothetical protein OpiT1DRAFT_05707 [Opitutaceae bacterium TAV1]|nr:hypothetical protein OpiT1DRAFT_05707 [Opitutaceae bacterium TAV1]
MRPRARVRHWQTTGAGLRIRDDRLSPGMLRPHRFCGLNFFLKLIERPEIMNTPSPR